MTRELVKAILFFFRKKKMQNGSAWNFPLAPNISVQQVHQPIFQNQRPFILLPLFFKECLNPQVRINKMVNEHKVNSYHILLQD